MCDQTGPTSRPSGEEATDVETWNKHGYEPSYKTFMFSKEPPSSVAVCVVSLSLHRGGGRARGRVCERGSLRAEVVHHTIAFATIEEEEVLVRGVSLGEGLGREGGREGGRVRLSHTLKVLLDLT